jgi:cytochrome c553
MKSWLWRGALALALLGMLGGLVMLSGIVPIKASSRHWAITAWLLEFSKQRSVSTHTLGINAPPLDDPRMVVVGGAYYEIGCRPCHGSPELRQPRIAARMTPPPVYLPPRIAKRAAEELFYVIKHGIKFTGMPGWPAPGRDDEVWTMVAFLKRLPFLNAAEYARVTRAESADDAVGAPLRALAAKSVATRRAVAENCSRCHGTDGMGRDGASPVIAGQRAAYIFASLHAYGRGRRHSGMMEPIAAGLSAQTMSELGHFYAGLAPTARAARSNSAAIARGRAIALGGLPQKKVPPCAECHGPGERRRNPFYPDLAGQHGDYLLLQLQLFKAGKRGGTAYAHLMQHVAPHLSEAQMRDVAAYYSSAVNGKD